MSVIQKSQLEMFVESFIRQNPRNKVGRQLINKAINLINAKLEGFCCDDYVGTVPKTTSLDNNLTHLVKFLVESRPKAGNVRALTKTRDALLRYLNCCAPAAPTLGVVDNTANTFNWTNNPSFTALSQYEFSLNGGTTWTTVTAKPIVVGNVAKAIGDVQVRVRAIGNYPASAPVTNQSPYTVV